MSVLTFNIKEDSGKKIWITSDTHYGHKNICKGVTDWRNDDGEIPIESVRDFPTIDKMNAAIVDNINNVVNHDDILIHVGDWSFGGFDNIIQFRSRIVCREIHIILGNHDHWIERNHLHVRNLFSSVNDYLILELNKKSFEIFHYPISSWRNIRKGSIHLHGHCHLSNDKKYGTGRRMDVGIDGHPEFRPYNMITEIIPVMMNRDMELSLTYQHTI